MSTDLRAIAEAAKRIVDAPPEDRLPGDWMAVAQAYDREFRPDRALAALDVIEAAKAFAESLSPTDHGGLRAALARWEAL